MRALVVVALLSGCFYVDSEPVTEGVYTCTDTLICRDGGPVSTYNQRLCALDWDQAGTTALNDCLTRGHEVCGRGEHCMVDCQWIPKEVCE